jgi:2',3'-cyclic-nucleotide 2'-phosphodiesterase (5'-nucleotidase family)
MQFMNVISLHADPILLKELQEWGKNVARLTKEEVGKTRVFLDGSAETCRLEECNLGNLVTDAMVYSVSLISISLEPIK